MFEEFLALVIVGIVGVSLIIEWKIYDDDINRIKAKLEIDENDIPSLKCPNILKEALQSCTDCMSNPLIAAKKIVNAYKDAVSQREYAEKDLKTIYLHFYKLWKIIKPQIIKTTYKCKQLKTYILIVFRNAFAHDNYVYKFLNDGRNRYEQLKHRLRSYGSKLPRHIGDNWLIWNINDKHLICFFISNKKLQALFQQFMINCKMMIQKSNANPS